MKKIIYKTAIFIFIVGSLSSCDDRLDQLPFDELSYDDALITAADFENGVRGIYQGLTAGGYYGSSDAGSLLSAPDVMSDNTTRAQRGRGTKQILHEFRYSATSTLSQFYANAYAVISRANLVLEYAVNFEGPSKANIIAEAKTLRAMAHFDLVRVFGKIPTQSADANGSLGVAYVTEFDPNAEPSRETVGFVYANVVADLVESAANINVANPEGRMGRDAVNTLLSRVYLYMGEWQNAIDAANNVTTPIAPRSQFSDIWVDESQAGLLLTIPNTLDGLNLNIGVTWSQGGLTNLIPEYVASFELVNLYAEDDIRKEAYIFSASNNASGLQFNAIKKLFGRTGLTNGLVDIKVMRAEEALLNKAEAQYELGLTAQALSTLNILRAQRYTSPPDGETGVALRDAIRLERRLEFAFEYQRFFDLKRWGVSIQRSAAGDLADGSGTPSEVLTLPAGDTKFQLPIGQVALDLNSNLVQNPGY